MIKKNKVDLNKLSPLAKRTLKNMENRGRNNPLKIKEVEKKPRKDMTKFIHTYLKTWLYRSPTIDVNTGKIQCRPKRARSVNDVYRICCYYFDNPPIEKFFTCLINLADKSLLGGIQCPDVGKFTLTAVNLPPWTYPRWGRLSIRDGTVTYIKEILGPYSDND